jgi:hypothetical protein
MAFLVRDVIKTKPEYACKFVIFVIQEVLTRSNIQMVFIYKFYLNNFFVKKSANQTNCVKKVLLVQPLQILGMFSATFCCEPC